MRTKTTTFFIPILLLFLIASLFPVERLSAYNGEKVNYIKVYKNNCRKCHGSDGKGTTRGKALGSPDFTDPNWQASLSNAEIVKAITNGKNKMPSWKSELTAQEIVAVGKFLRSFAKKKLTEKV